MTSAFAEDGYLPLGRHSCDPDEAKALLVDNPLFEDSRTRAELWTNFERYLTIFLTLEDRYSELLPGPLVDRVWLGGSFVSAKRDPRNIDTTSFVNRAAHTAIRGKEGAGVFSKSRDYFLDEFKLSPLFVYYEPVVSVFKLDELEDSQRAYLLSRGAWDDWWQRRRQDGERQAPTVETCEPRRGYLEVVLNGW